MNKVSYFVMAAFPDGSMWVDGKKYNPPYKAGCIECNRRYTAFFNRDAIRGKGFW